MATYQKDFDYSEAIANESDEGKRQKLLAERQNKIDAEGLAGKVAGNDAVSTWTSGYRPYSASSTKSGGLTVSALYDAAEQSRLSQFEAVRRRIARQLRSNLSSIENDYTAGMTQTDINARKSVMGNEEKMAALGLNMGSRYADATSGAAETSRIAVDNQYRSDLNTLGTARLSARAAAQQSADDQLDSLSGSYYAASSDAALQQAQAALQQYNADRDYSLSVAGLSGFLNGTPTLAYRQYQTDQTTAQTQAAYEQAVNRWKTYGYVVQGDADILGVPSGTPTADVRYKNATLSLQRWKAGYGY